MKNQQLNEEQRAKWLRVTKNEYMSSEKSGADDTITVHRPGWRSAYVNQNNVRKNRHLLC